MYPSKPYTLDEEIESWKGFPWALRKEDVEVWERMIRRAKEYEYAIKKSGRWLTTEPFFIAILFLQYKTIRSLEGEVERLRRDGKRVLDRLLVNNFWGSPGTQARLSSNLVNISSLKTTKMSERDDHYEKGFENLVSSLCSLS